MPTVLPLVWKKGFLTLDQQKVAVIGRAEGICCQKVSCVKTAIMGTFTCTQLIQVPLQMLPGMQRKPSEQLPEQRDRQTDYAAPVDALEILALKSSGLFQTVFQGTDAAAGIVKTGCQNAAAGKLQTEIAAIRSGLRQGKAGSQRAGGFLDRPQRPTYAGRNTQASDIHEPGQRAYSLPVPGDTV